ncbi:Glutamate synthase (ferredoxin) [Gloeothece citriformis PCC 7424]|uniref:glutamate synthase (ferredoxin) n=1 Tax=Gloeothece citriformis (strain PCC 7424) TaxID=65393 RepID=B7K8F0_GLOC7|nr:glutamate synthase large subunit [Gloeothece citriformis]ACK69910.1 Glutamate synthase (ferredoxin) [Gloeothece citriformis PCC 7424]
MNNNHSHNSIATQFSDNPYWGPRWLTEERDACGVGFIADLESGGSHRLIEQALAALGCLEHRGGCSADNDSGDGSGIMTAIPRAILEPWFVEHGMEMPPFAQLGVGMIFLPQDPQRREEAIAYVEEVVKGENLKILGWRDVPVRPELLGRQARENQPYITQLLVSSSEGLSGAQLDRVLYVARSRIGKRLADDFYVCSFSCRTIVYKGMVRGVILGEFYEDLKNPAYSSQFAVYHRRFSTNTMPKWPFAQPMRLLGHNGEINTLLGNINWMAAQEGDLGISGWSESQKEALTPIVNPDNSDSYNLDSTMELLVRTGRNPCEAAMILVPEAYSNQPELKDHPEIVDFYEFYSGLQEPWDGPALLVFSDGVTVGALLDRNGLRPARYCITKDSYVVVGSEAGVVPLDEADIVEKGRLGPGQMLAVDLEKGEILKNWEIKGRVAAAQPYGEWLRECRQEIGLESEPEAGLVSDGVSLLQYQTAFGYTAEDVEMILVPMAASGKEPTFCMGDDTPLAVLSDKPRVLYDYFKQRFAQVTNPPIDPLRESLVMSLTMFLGERGNLIAPDPAHIHQIKLETPILSSPQLEGLKKSGLKTVELSTLFAVLDGPEGLETAINQLCVTAADEVKAGAKVIILSDRAGGMISEETSYIPPLLAVGAVHHHLIREGLRLKASLVVDTAQCWSTHHLACLIGYGASAVCPYLAMKSIIAWWHDPKTQKLMENGKIEQVSLEGALSNFRKALEAGLLKILSKMGISLLSSYHGAQIFEAIGLGADLIKLGFRGTTSRVGGLSVVEVAQEVINVHKRAFPNLTAKKLENLGFVNYRPGGEYHMNSPEMAKNLHKAVELYERDGNGAPQEAFDYYELYRKYLSERPVTALRDLLEFNGDRSPINVDEVEPVEEIVKRFCTGGMSLGALSREAHETLAIAMNRIGGKSNSGEGGEDPTRFITLDDVNSEGKSAYFPHLNGLHNGDTASSAIKQVASGRFGVTPEYLINAQQLEIKMAQGAKPGEGGQLPGKKVSAYIAQLRRSKPGVTLISPPPHHDIYSIEDLAQLIFDLHQINPVAKVSVKLVAEIGIGTIAAGVAKANADIIQISGHDGGTGASPLSSIKHAGSPWELGLTEVHRVLLQNQLRDRVILRADGGLKTGWDVVMAAVMGAEEFGFGSIAMIAEGCIMARICHTNNCPVGVATQQERLRQRFSGTPAHVVNFFYFVAAEVRSILAALGYRSLDEVIGRSDLLQARSGVKVTKTSGLTVECLLNLPEVKTDRSWLNHEEVHSNGDVLDDEILGDPDIIQAIEQQKTVELEVAVLNTHRTVGARIAGVIAKKYGNDGFTGELTLKFKGAAGQSFGAFNLPGMKLFLEGEANDYVGKGMYGGEIVIVPPSDATYNPSDNSIVGNTCLYGATGGYLFVYGRAGERFGVRNSFATAVVEGTGDHCCEYMTGGVIVVLGSVGRNVGAGMTGGLAYFLDEDGSFPEKVNSDIKIQRIGTPVGEAQLKGLIERHGERTGSAKAKMILENWESYIGKFWQAVPPSEAQSPEVNRDAIAQSEKTLTSV